MKEPEPRSRMRDWNLIKAVEVKDAKEKGT